MVAARGTAAPLPKAPFYLELRPLDKRAGERWWLSFEDDILTLMDPAEAPVLQLHREEAARYLHLTKDLFRGRIVTFAVTEGLHEYPLRIDKEPLAKLLSWLPNPAAPQRLKEVRKASVAVCLFGILHLLPDSFLSWQWGVLLLAAGGFGLLFPGRECYAINGAVLLAAGLWDLFPWYTPGIDPRAVPWEQRLIPVVTGSLLILWGIQQFSMLGLNQELRAARAIRDLRAAFVPQARDSRVVRRIGLATAAAAVLFGLYGLVVGVVWALQDQRPPWNETDPLRADLIVGCGVGILAAASAAALLLRRRALYREARVAGQLVVASGICVLWATASYLTGSAGGDQQAFHGMIGANLSAFAQPYVWMLAIGGVLLFNRWFARAVDRELEELRD